MNQQSIKENLNQEQKEAMMIMFKDAITSEVLAGKYDNLESLHYLVNIEEKAIIGGKVMGDLIDIIQSNPNPSIEEHNKIVADVNSVKNFVTFKDLDKDNEALKELANGIGYIQQSLEIRGLRLEEQEIAKKPIEQDNNLAIGR